MSIFCGGEFLASLRVSSNLLFFDVADGVRRNNFVLSFNPIRGAILGGDGRCIVGRSAGHGTLIRRLLVNG